MYRQLWNSLHQRVSALDELSMCTMRLRLRFPGENIPENQFYIVDPTEVCFDFFYGMYYNPIFDLFEQ